MQRRDATLALLVLFSSRAVAPAYAQAPGKVYRIGFLGPTPESAPHLVKAFQDGLRDVGLIEGKNVIVIYRWTNAPGTEPADKAMLLANAQALVDQKVDIISASIDPAVFAASQATRTIPIVMMNVSDPIDGGFVQSLARPGGNITGSVRLSPELVGRCLQLLREVAPNAKRYVLFVNASNRSAPSRMRISQEAAQAQGIGLQVVEVRTAAEIPAGFAEIKRLRAEAVLVADDGMFFSERSRITDLLLAQRLPGMFTNTEYVEAGGLISYSPSSADNYRRAGKFIDKILRGARPGELPVEQPKEFELAINTTTAKAIGVVIPKSVLVQAPRFFS